MKVCYGMEFIVSEYVSLGIPQQDRIRRIEPGLSGPAFAAELLRIGSWLTWLEKKYPGKELTVWSDIVAEDAA